MMVECLSRKRKFTEKIPLRHSSVFFVNVRKPSGLQLGVRACARLSLTREKRNLACLSRSSSRNWFARVHQDTANQSEIYIYISHLEILKKGSSKPPVTLISAARETAVLIVLIRTKNLVLFRLTLRNNQT